MNLGNKRWLIILIAGFIILRFSTDNVFLFYFGLLTGLVGIIDTVVAFKHSKWGLLKAVFIIMVSIAIAMTIVLVNLNSIRTTNQETYKQCDIIKTECCIERNDCLNSDNLTYCLDLETKCINESRK